MHVRAPRSRPATAPGRARRVRRLSAALGVTAVAATVAFAGPASANPPGKYDPMGSVTSVKAVKGGVAFTGWAFDQSARTSNLEIDTLIDGKAAGKPAHTTVRNAAITKKYGTSATPGFSTSVAVDAKSHVVCVVAKDLGFGQDTILKCVGTPLGRTLTAAQTAAHSPKGAITRYWANKHSVHFQGWATDPDLISRRSTIVLYVDNKVAASKATQGAPPAPRPAGSNANSAFDILVPTAVGTHVGCVWVVNVGIGNNVFLGCRTMDNRGAAGTGHVSVPSLNTKVAAEAKKHIGQPYVWGATGPKRFDCSGLVMYSYNKFGYSTPRISEDQFRAARLIPASRAVPGDPVFYFDSQGDVYHVGIYLSPGKTVAAIDPQEGVNYQQIWDPSMTAYGSFTHT